ncbi:hypothetical protein [uncultured Desulfobulbus sp.]|uniref:hypothetical protein n=1 Tax=uncultured Desulfobulbus sp. TaxID=239745 RepID=UPI0029C83A7D|nr:hypothetical protein [uncultured Desulfobulbus sp.]
MANAHNQGQSDASQDNQTTSDHFDSQGFVGGTISMLCGGGPSSTYNPPSDSSEKADYDAGWNHTKSQS